MYTYQLASACLSWPTVEAILSAHVSYDVLRRAVQHRQLSPGGVERGGDRAEGSAECFWVELRCEEPADTAKVCWPFGKPFEHAKVFAETINPNIGQGETPPEPTGQ